jgi:transcriptional regulator with XRE-family HTH domain
MSAITLGQRIRALRRERRLTQRQLAGQAGVNFTYLSKIENDRLEHTPSLKTLQELARALEVDELELMELADKVPPVLDALARDKEALRFFRRATQSVTTPEGWRELHDYLDRREKAE